MAQVKSVDIDADGHSFGTEWKSDETNHWHECSCGERADVAEHDFEWVIDEEATMTEPGSKHEECKICGYKKAAAAIPATSSTKPGVPKTGDESRVALWICLGVASLGIAATLLLLNRKRKTSR